MRRAFIGTFGLMAAMAVASAGVVAFDEDRRRPEPRREPEPEPEPKSLPTLMPNRLPPPRISQGDREKARRLRQQASVAAKARSREVSA